MSKCAATATVLTLVGVVAGVGTRNGGFADAAFSGISANTGNTFAAASSFCSAPGTSTVTASADAYVSQEFPTTTYGAETSLQVASFSAENKRTLVRFSLPAIPSDCTITAAKLQFSVVLSSSGRTLQVGRFSSWTESTTWNTQPSMTGTAATTSSGASPVEFDVVSQVQAMYAGTNDGFIVRDSVEDSLAGPTQAYYSRESGIGPRLVITFG